MAVPLDQLAVSFRLLDRVEIFALDVLDQRKLGSGRIVNVADERRNLVQARPLGSAPSTLAGDDLEPVVRGPHEDWLKNTALRDRIREFVDRLLVELHAGLNRARLDPPDLDFTDAIGALRRGVSGRRR